MEIIPAIDIIDGKCIRLSQGDYSRMTTYSENPLEVARRFESAGIKRLHLVDLDGARAQHIVNYRVLENISSHTGLIIDFGGGLKTEEDLRIAFECGASMITGGSIAIKSPEIFQSWIEKYGSEKIILGADAKEGKIAVSGWQEDSGTDIYTFIIQWRARGISKVISTDISRDGMLTGPSISLYKRILETLPDIYLIASGGVSSVSDIEELSEAGVPAVITGKALYEGKITMNELEKYLKNFG